jgi:hypothetical protein
VSPLLIHIFMFFALFLLGDYLKLVPQVGTHSIF